MNGHYRQRLHLNSHSLIIIKDNVRASSYVQPPVDFLNFWRPFQLRDWGAGQDSIITLDQQQQLERKMNTKKKERKQAFNLCRPKDLKCPTKPKQPGGRANCRAVVVIDGHLACSVRLSICRIHKKRCWGNYVCHDILKAGTGEPRNGWQL